MKVINLRTYPTLLTFSMVSGSLAYASLLNTLWPEICWTPRLGGLLVGVAVFMQGYVGVNEKKFSACWRWGLTRGQAYLHVANVFAVFGTGMWAFGDLLPSSAWFTNLACAVPV
ncbi:MAG: hypothetical protein QNL70_04765 [Pseudomonas sp.]